jgi:flagellar motor switch protein FliN
MTVAEQINRYAELPMVLESELGRCMLPMRDILALSPGSVIKLPVATGSNVKLLVGGAPFGAAEVVRIGNAAAIRLLSFHKRKGD